MRINLSPGTAFPAKPFVHPAKDHPVHPRSLLGVLTGHSVGSQ